MDKPWVAPTTLQNSLGVPADRSGSSPSRCSRLHLAGCGWWWLQRPRWQFPRGNGAALNLQAVTKSLWKLSWKRLGKISLNLKLRRAMVGGMVLNLHTHNISHQVTVFQICCSRNMKRSLRSWRKLSTRKVFLILALKDLWGWMPHAPALCHNLVHWCLYTCLRHMQHDDTIYIAQNLPAPCLNC